MNAIVSVGISDNGRTDINVIRRDRSYYASALSADVHVSHIHANITDASFSRLARLIARRGSLSHTTGTMIHYRVS